MALHQAVRDGPCAPAGLRGCRCGVPCHATFARWMKLTLLVLLPESRGMEASSKPLLVYRRRNRRKGTAAGRPQS